MDTRQLAAACARSAVVYRTCTSFSASAIVVGVISGPTAGPVPKAGGVPGGADGGGAGACAEAARARLAPARPRAESRRKRRRFFMGGFSIKPGAAAARPSDNRNFRVAFPPGPA